MRETKSGRAIPVFQTVLFLVLAALVVFSVTAPGQQFWKQMFRRSGFAVNNGAPLKIHVLDVGKADAILVECEGRAALIDAGTYLDGDTVVDYMHRNHISNLDYAVATHPDKDHIGGMSQVLSEVGAGSFLRSRYFEEEYGEVDTILKRQGIPCQIVSAGDMIELGGAQLHFLGPMKEYEETNDASLVFRLEYRNFSALFCGDIEEEGEKDLVKSGAELHADLLKVPHHGSKTSSAKKFLKLVWPKYAVISVGRDRNDLPNEETLIRLENSGVEEIYRTDTDGTVVFCSDGEEIEIITER